MRLLGLFGAERRTSDAVRVALVFLAMLAVAERTPLAAEEQSKLEPPDPALYRRWGPVRVRPGLEITNLGYDTNILNSQNAVAVGDYTITISPRITGLVLLGSRSFLTFRDRFEYTAYLNYQNQNFPNNRFETRWTLPVQRAGLFVAFGLDNIQERPIDLEDLRTRQKTGRAQVGIILEPGWRTEIEISRNVRDFTYTDPDYSDITTNPAGRALDRTESGTLLEASWRVAGRTKLLFDARLESVAFDYPGKAQDVDIDRDGDSRDLLTGARFGEGGRLVGEVELGWGRYQPNVSELPAFSDWIGTAELVYRMGSRTRFTFTGERLPGFSVIPGCPYYLNSEFGVRAVHYLTRMIGLEAGGSRGTLTFPKSFVFAGREDVLRYLDAGIRFRLLQSQTGERVEYSVRIQRYDRDSNVPFVDRSSASLTFGVVLGY